MSNTTKWSSRSRGEVASTLLFKFPERKKHLLAWDVTFSAATPLHCLAMTRLSISQNLQKVDNDIVIFIGNVLGHAWHTWYTRRVPSPRSVASLPRMGHRSPPPPIVKTNRHLCVDPRYATESQHAFLTKCTFKGEVQSRITIISKERVKISHTRIRNKEVETFRNINFFRKTFLDQSLWIFKWASWWCHALTIFHMYCIWNFENFWFLAHTGKITHTHTHFSTRCPPPPKNALTHGTPLKANMHF